MPRYEFSVEDDLDEQIAILAARHPLIRVTAGEFGFDAVMAIIVRVGVWKLLAELEQLE